MAEKQLGTAPSQLTHTATKSYVDTAISNVIIKVDSFGAKGDGTTDDTAAIHSARDAVGDGGVLSFPNGTYLVTGLDATIENQTWILDKKAVIKLQAGSDVTLTVSAENFTIKGGTLDATSNNLYDGTQNCILVNADNLTLKETTVIGGGYAGLRSDDHEEITITGCTFIDPHYGAVMIANYASNSSTLSNFIVTDNIFKCSNSTGSALTFFAQTNGTFDHVVVSRNRITLPYDQQGGNETGCITVYNGINYTVSDNVMSGGHFGLSLPSSTNATIANNSIRGFKTVGIELPGNNEKVTVSGNSLDADGVTNSVGQQGIWTSAGTQKDIAITGNVIGNFTGVVGTSCTAISFGSNSVVNGVTLSGNTLTSEVSAGQFNGITTNCPVTGMVITGNFFDASSTASSAGIQFLGATNNVVVVANQFSNIAMRALILYSNESGANISNVRFTSNVIRNCNQPTIDNIVSSPAVLSDLVIDTTISNPSTISNLVIEADSDFVSAKRFGAVGDGIADDTAALTSWVTYVVSNRSHGFLPNGTYKITDTLVVPTGQGWTISGESRIDTQIIQHTNNIPVMQLGTNGGGYQHSTTLENLFLTYNTAQPSTNTNANCLVFESIHGDSGPYWSVYRNLVFSKGFYGMKVPSGGSVPWGCRFDMLEMYETMSGGMYDNQYCNTAGGVNNVWGRTTMRVNNAVGPVFRNWNTAATHVEAFEFLEAHQGQTLIQSQAPFTCDFGTLRLENGTYTASGNSQIFNFSGEHFVRIGLFDIGGVDSHFTPSGGGKVTIFGLGNAATDNSYFELSSATCVAQSLSGTCVLLGGGSSPNKRIKIGNVRLDNGWALQDTGGTIGGNYTKVESWVNDSLSLELPNADYTVTVGDPNKLHFCTAFTAQRTIILPHPGGNSVCGSLYYDLIFDGAINGSNTAVIKYGTTILRVQADDGIKLRYQWRRGNYGGQWVLVEIVPFKVTGSFGTKVAVPSTSSSAGLPGNWAADASYIYTYTGDGTTHSWVRATAASW